MVPFNGDDLKVVAAWADGHIDISDEAVFIKAPEALRVIHDREYATPPRSFREYRLRIQYLAELGVGRLIRKQKSHEDSVADAINEQLGN